MRTRIKTKQKFYNWRLESGVVLPDTRFTKEHKAINIAKKNAKEVIMESRAEKAVALANNMGILLNKGFFIQKPTNPKKEKLELIS